MAYLGDVGFNNIHVFHWASYFLLVVLSESLILVDCPRGEILYIGFSKLVHPETIFLVESLWFVFQGKHFGKR